VLESAYSEQLERLIRKRLKPPLLPAVVWINPPKEVTAATQ
jgi:hypothetical protein